MAKYDSNIETMDSVHYPSVLICNFTLLFVYVDVSVQYCILHCTEALSTGHTSYGRLIAFSDATLKYPRISLSQNCALSILWGRVKGGAWGLRRCRWAV